MAAVVLVAVAVEAAWKPTGRDKTISIFNFLGLLIVWCVGVRVGVRARHRVHISYCG